MSDWSGGSGHWVEDPDNAFNRMSWTRGGAGRNNEATRESNARRAGSMPGVDALPRFATPGVGAAAVGQGDQFVVGDLVYEGAPPNTTGPGRGGVATGSQGGGSGPGSGRVASGPLDAGGVGSGSRLVVMPPGGPYRDGYRPGPTELRFGTGFSTAPKIDGVENQPLKRVGTGGQQEALGAISDIGFARTATGWIPTPSQDMKERIEDDMFMQGSFFVRNYLVPMFIGGQEHSVRPDFLDPEYSHYVPALNEWRAGTFTRPSGYRTGGGF